MFVLPSFLSQVARFHSFVAFASLDAASLPSASPQINSGKSGEFFQFTLKTWDHRHRFNTDMVI
jgi:hypothetical protein